MEIKDVRKIGTHTGMFKNRETYLTAQYGIDLLEKKVIERYDSGKLSNKDILEGLFMSYEFRLSEGYQLDIDWDEIKNYAEACINVETRTVEHVEKGPHHTKEIRIQKKETTYEWNKDGYIKYIQKYLEKNK